MRVCHVTSGHSPFDGRIFYKECRSLAWAGYDVTLVAPADFDERWVNGVRVVGITSKGNGWRGRSRRWGALVRAVRQTGASVVHFHDPDLLVLSPFFRPARVVYDCHEYYAYNVSQRRGWPRLLRRLLGTAVAVTEPLLASRTDAIILVEDGQKQTFQRVRKDQVMIYNYPIIETSPPSRTGNERTAIYVGSHSESKGCGTMVEAMQLVVREIADARLLLVGPFNRLAYLDHIQQRIAQAALEGNILLTGAVPHSQVIDWLARADLGLVPFMSRYQPSIPTKLFEYMIAALPVIASDLPNHRRFLEQANCGYLVEPEEPAAYADRIIHLFRNPDEAKHLGSNGRRAVEKRFNWHQEEVKLLALYRRLTAS
jgi:glycosyltransferase involved in cell wall biosynthesis